VPNPVVVLGDSSRLKGQRAMRLSRKQRAVVTYIEHNPKFAAFATAAELGSRAGVHPSTVVRLSQLLGYRGFPEFQEEIRHQYLNSLDAVGIMHANAGETHGDVALASIRICEISQRPEHPLIEMPCVRWPALLNTRQPC
jgi:DNA-binding MurR/RpiR family transcriptional regulator